MSNKTNQPESDRLKESESAEEYLIVKSKKKLWQIVCFVFIILFLTCCFVAFLYVKSYYGSVSQGAYFNSAFKVSTSSECSLKEGNNMCVRRLIDGVYVRAGQENFYPVAVIIENHIDSRPPSGLAKANLVYEAEAEGGITRYLAIYSSGDPIEEIGPVRSVRPYFIDWASEISALLAHCGGSPEALAKIVEGNVLNLNEFYHSNYFWRDDEKSSPHNVYTSAENLEEYLEGKKLIKGNFLSWKYKEDLAFNFRPQASEISITYKIPDFLVQWKYNREENDYLRYLGGEIHKDKSGQKIRAKNIIIEYVKAEVLDNELRLKMSNLGSGKAIICYDGKCQTGSWRKDRSSSRSHFYNDNSEEIELNAGVTWIEVVKPGLRVDYK